MSRDLSLSRLTTELRDFLDLPETLDLPHVTSVSCELASYVDSRWKCRARIAHCDDSAVLHQALATWAAYVGGTIEESKPYPSGMWPSQAQRNLTLRVVVAEVEIELYALVDGEFELPVAADTALAVSPR